MRSPFALLLLLVCACRTPPLDLGFGDGGGPVGGDMAGTVSHDMARGRDMHSPPTSCCGVPGNPGNEQGVGKFCMSSADCMGQPANICATVADPTFTFCIKICSATGGNQQCGSGAQCQCGMGGMQCACVPGECTMPPPGC
jgi:hypothetical protein